MISKIIAYAIGAVPAAVITSWAVDRSPPSVTLEAHVINGPVRAGDDARIRYRVHRYRSCEYTVDRYLYDADNVRIVLDDLLFLSASGPLGDVTYIAPVPIPSNFAPGIARYRTNIAYRCNLLHRIWPIIVEGNEVQFSVVR